MPGWTSLGWGGDILHLLFHPDFPIVTCRTLAPIMTDNEIGGNQPVRASDFRYTYGCMQACHIIEGSVGVDIRSLNHTTGLVVHL
jgi:hypothetical protein